MAKNQVLFDKLNNFDTLRNFPDSNLRNSALTALYQANSANPAAFKQAFIDHKPFWDRFYPTLATDPIDLEPTENPNQTFPEIQQTAAAQYIKLNLTNLQQDQLKGIFEKDYEEAKIYIRTLPSLGANLPLPTLFNDAGIKSIREQAAIEFILLRIAESTNPQILFNYLSNPNENASAEALGIPSQGRVLTTPLPLVISKRINEKLSALNLQAFKDQIHAQSPDQILALGRGITTDEQLKIILKTVSPGMDTFFDGPLANEASAVFISSFLESSASKHNVQELYGKLKLSDADLKTQAQTDNTLYFLEHHENTNREILFKQFTQKCEDAYRIPQNNPVGILTELTTQSSLAGFKQVLTKYKFAEVQSITDDNRKAIQQAARTGRFELLIGQNRPQLITGLSGLSITKQNQLLHDNEKLESLARSLDPRVLVVAGINNEQATQILDEKRRHYPFQLIHNSAMARILADIKPDIDIDQDMAESINRTLVTLPPTTRAKNLATPGEFKSTIDAVYAACHAPGNPGDFYKAFGLAEDGAEPANNSKKDQIIGQQNFNAGLLAAYHSAPSLANKQLLSLFLNSAKEFKFEDFQIRRISTAFLTDTNILECFDNIIKDSDTDGIDPADKENLLNAKQHLLYELNRDPFKEETFQRLKKADRIEKITSATANDQDSMEKAETAFKELDDGLLTLKLGRARFHSISKQLQEVENIKPHHIHTKLLSQFKTNPGMATQKEQNFNERAQACQTYIDSLNRDMAVLNEFPTFQNTVLPERVSDVKTEIDKQKREVTHLLQVYTSYQNKLNQITKAVAYAKMGQPYLTKPYGFDMSIVDGNNPPEVKQLAGPTLSANVAASGELAEALNPGQSRMFTSPQGNITETYTAEKKRSFTLGPFPAENMGDNNKARVQFAMMSAMLILEMHAPITKNTIISLDCPNRIAATYIWTALVGLSKAHDNMRFNSNQINLKDANFDPKRDQKPPKSEFEQKNIAEFTREFKRRMDNKFAPIKTIPLATSDVVTKEIYQKLKPIETREVINQESKGPNRGPIN
ncbi:MAG: hypothetical protein H0U75_06520 [Legionella sp.]|nr:hypothetical protein [Legionella sp.]